MFTLILELINPSINNIDNYHCFKQIYGQNSNCVLWCTNITIEFMFAGINMFWARLRLILESKMSLRRAQNIFMLKNINSITINITLEGTEKKKTEKNDNKTL